MASFKKEGNSIGVQIRKKDLKLYASFKNMEDAQLWAAYKEDIHDLIKNFEPPTSELITLSDAIDIKLADFPPTSNNYRDIQYLKNVFSDILDRQISELTYEFLLKEYKRIKEVPVIKGGNKRTGTGKEVLPSQVTVMKKFILLNSVINCLIQKGLTVRNNVQTLVTHLRNSEQACV